MNFVEHLTIVPLWTSLLLAVILPTVIVLAALFALHRARMLERFRTSIEVTSFSFATIGLIYTVLVGFSILVAWEKFHDAGEAVRKEAGASAALYRLSDGLGQEAGAALRAALTAYLESAVSEDWRAMREAGTSENTTRALTRVYDAVLAAPVSDGRQAEVLGEIFDELAVVTEARRDQNTLANGAVPGIIWLVLIVGGAMTIVSTFFFTPEDLFAHAVLSGMLTVIVCLSILAVVSISYPFSGPVSVSSQPITEMLGDFSR